ncbi:transmembrane 4 L6 family member 5-like isoform X3 [Gopherus evgoodei]|uniref:transmembrane 4 L6 family member 5-like isoform X3 n=1 Tax=Gopherus evgoodei TaxID=1825980 RepID=UPI0011CFD58A|nr:transmembrane 4 L6 family member 5-like isoform X3 [Gopherus evgoodei]
MAPPISTYCPGRPSFKMAAPSSSLPILIPAIHIQATSRQACCGNRCGMFLSILFALVGVAGSVYAVSVSALGLVNGPLCQVREDNGSLSTWAQPFRSAHEELSEQSYLFNTSTWDACVNPPGVIRFNVTLFSLVLVAALMELLLCGVQVLNGLFGCLCGTCNKKQDRGPKQSLH